MKNLIIHNIHPYHGKFYPGIPQYFISKYAIEANRILDPFCGSGTTLLEASIRGFESVGVDTNFLSCKISKTKIFNANPDKIKQLLNVLINSDDCSDISFKDGTVWFSQKNYYELCCIYNTINKIEDINYKNIFEVCLSGILKAICNKRKTWNNGYIADNILPNVECEKSLKKVFEQKINNVIKAYEELKNYTFTNSSVFEKNILDYNPVKKFDIVITSPPYPFAVDFARYNRLSYYLFNEDLDSAVSKETGARNKRNKKNCVENFFNEIKILYLHIMELINTNGYFCMTVCNTQRDKKEIKFVEWLIDLFHSKNWGIVENTERYLQNQSMPQKRLPKEHLLVFKKRREI